MSQPRRVPVVLGAAIGVVLAGAAAASAHYRAWTHHDCKTCGPVAPTTHYRTIETSKAETRYHDVNVVRHVQRVHRVTDVTRIQPVIRIHDVTRVHHHTIFVTRTAYRYVTQYLPPMHLVTYGVRNYYDCSCGW